MQRTRLNTLVDDSLQQATQFFANPWRRISLILLTLFFGIFIGEAVSTTVGQAAQWDVVVAAIMLIFTELASRWVYRRSPQNKPRSLWTDVLNVFKMGIAYSLYLEAFKLGS
ncbi:MAG: DUF565 domain-containing protein [Microcystaceae cyanobacterium]